MQTKEKILTASRGLFNRYGYRNVTMRQIAAEVGISPGNLTYYFRHKADIVTALMDISFEKTYLAEPIETFEDLMLQFGRMLQTIRTNAFFFLDDELGGGPNEHSGTIRIHLLNGMANLTQKGVFKETFTPELRKTVLDMLLMTHMTWVRFAVRGGLEMTAEELLDAHRTIFLPYLV